MTTSATSSGGGAVRYAHTQTGWLTMIIVGAVSAAIVAMVLGVRIGRSDAAVGPLVTGAVLVVMLLTVVCFSSLTVRVTEREVRWRFGPGPFGGRIALADVESVEPTRTPLWAGLGIHWIGRGWVYNVSGRGAVMIVERSGKTTWVGSDEPEALAAAIEGARGR